MLVDNSSSFAAKKRIFDALYELMQNHQYKDIKVTDICEKAGISRTAFYHHFDSKFDVASWHSDMILRAGVDLIGDSLTWFEGHYITTQGIKCFYDFYSRIERPDGNKSVFLSHHAQHRIDVLHHTLSEVKKIEITPLLEFQIYAMARTEDFAMHEWYSGRLDVPLKTVCDYMVSIVPHELYKALEKPEHPSGLGGAILFRELMYPQ